MWRGRTGRLWRLADHLEVVSQAVRYADKPHDLVYPITRITDLTNQVRDIQWLWIAEKMGMDKRDMGRWPKL